MTDQATPLGVTPAAGDLPESAGRVLLEILINGPLPRVELARRLGLSGPSLTRLTRPLIASGRLIEGVARHQSVGRPLQPLDIDVSSEHFIGIKLTGGALYAVVTDLRGEVLAESERSLNGNDPAVVAAEIATEVARFGTTFAGLTGVGIALGGRSPDGRVVGEANFLGWRNVPLADLVEVACNLPVVVANDVNALTQAQHWFGAGRGLDSFAVVTVGAGVGLGLVMHGRLVQGVHGGAGSIGHQVLTNSDATCWRGHRGCANALLSAQAIEAATERATGSPAPLDVILRGAERGDPALRAIVDQAGEALGLLIAGVANFADPQKILIAGEGARLGTVGGHAMLRAFHRAGAWETTETPIDVQPFAFNEWARGAAASAIYARVMA
ncbi:ROK family protein [Dactylosporangium siamense]|uniref:Sugar kinase n=1 Tax=Dactylosporangium siamense TaxID=685454 RepID=A0A919PRF9_9ACTN|nr:ROK family transcriptional regulator [Dactylosporangium siamense]GIG47976.1 sugar kinase [Dactylosporangium siamense]